MTYDRFVMSILERVQKGVGDSVSVSVYTAVKNNGTKRKGLDFDTENRKYLDRQAKKEAKAAAKAARKHR